MIYTQQSIIHAATMTKVGEERLVKESIISLIETMPYHKLRELFEIKVDEDNTTEGSPAYRIYIRKEI